MGINGYNEDKAPDSRIEHIRKTSEKALPMPDPEICVKCAGFGEVIITDDEGRIVSRNYCQDCEGTGAKL